MLYLSHGGGGVLAANAGVVESSSMLLTRVLNDPTPTTDATSERYLAVALGYPTTWRVCRQVSPMPLLSSSSSSMLIKDDQAKINDEASTMNDGNNKNNMDLAKHPSITKEEKKAYFIQDVIYAGNPKKGVDRWYCHEAAQMAAASAFMESKTATTISTPSPYHFKGGHLLKRIPKFEKGNAVQVLYQKSWYMATILKRKEYDDGFKYMVMYTEDDSTQEDIREDHIRVVPPKPSNDTSAVMDPQALELAKEMGLPDGWGVQKFNRRTLYTAPTGDTFTNKKTALSFAASVATAKTPKNNDKSLLDNNDDPPWRTSGHPYLGRKVLYSHVHKLSGVRSVTVEQEGTVVGWISDTDRDRHGAPGYISEDTGKPAALFHIVFHETERKRSTQNYLYAKYLIQSIDQEEHEVKEVLLEEEDVDVTQKSPPRKKNKTSSVDADNNKAEVNHDTDQSSPSAKSSKTGNKRTNVRNTSSTPARKRARRSL